MRRLILASHGQLAQGMKHTVEMIVGENEGITCLMLEPGHHPDELKQMAEQRIQEFPDDEFIIICDLFGGSVANALMHLCPIPKVHVLTGMNPALVISLCTANEEEVTTDVIHNALQEAKKYMLYTNELM